MLYLIEILHQTTTNNPSLDNSSSCILSKFYIKPQRAGRKRHSDVVVSYRNSTSNHNGPESRSPSGTVVSYRNSTSNHNFSRPILKFRLLYLIEILHQTTTYSDTGRRDGKLYLIEILHQTTTSASVMPLMSGLYLIEILHQTTTPPHGMRRSAWLYLIEILHQTTTSGLILIDKVLLTGCLPL